MGIGGRVNVRHQLGRRGLGRDAGAALIGSWAFAADPITSFGSVFDTKIRQVVVAAYEKQTGKGARAGRLA